jgi:phenylalanine-4-hydroxylase
MTEGIAYTQKDNSFWNKLYTQQVNHLQGMASPVFFELLDKINLPSDRVPQLNEVSRVLEKNTGWQLTAANGIVSQQEFFYLLSKKIFPSTTFLRTQQEEGLAVGPDIFHELFGHATMLLDERYSSFMNKIGETALDRAPLQQAAIRRLLWFTSEVGLIKIGAELRIFGGALLSSFIESSLALSSPKVKRAPFDIVNIFRTPFRADLFQEHQDFYYYINDFNDLLEIDLSDKCLNDYINKAKKLKEYPIHVEIQGKYASINIFDES